MNEQYDSDASMAFYEHVMGGGGDDIHYGIFRKEKDGLKQSSQNSVEELARMAEECGALKKVPLPLRHTGLFFEQFAHPCRKAVGVCEWMFAAINGADPSNTRSFHAGW